ncbi:uncharacterized protein LOC109836514 isoform X3 [Asparagus officinalis]|uniref:uncharacterized protein LOC109836514 isoform X3 n=1 Tax=Asparagus officinalis TaxID=4686 RepID=UPI00098DE6A1|nr:uncharacterized protein LOC109836514 isoform X3 [Asparagus officinalis]XP_020260014.1 uncharacterized protein LOC109836514 isoform X3 [Asparagus officinalis]
MQRSRIVRIKACFKSSSFSCVSFISLLSTTKCFLAFFNYSRIITKRALKKKLAGRSQILLLELELRSSFSICITCRSDLPSMKPLMPLRTQHWTKFLLFILCL